MATVSGAITPEVSTSPKAVTGVKLTAILQGYYNVRVNGVVISKHTQEREAIDRAVDEKIKDPLADVRYNHAYEVKVELE